MALMDGWWKGVRVERTTDNTKGTRRVGSQPVSVGAEVGEKERHKTERSRSEQTRRK